MKSACLCMFVQVCCAVLYIMDCNLYKFVFSDSDNDDIFEEGETRWCALYILCACEEKGGMYLAFSCYIFS